MHNLLYHRLRERRMNHKEKYQIALTLELIHKLIFAMNYIPHLLLLFAFYWTGNFVRDLVPSYQNHIPYNVEDIRGF